MEKTILNSGILLPSSAIPYYTPVDTMVDGKMKTITLKDLIKTRLKDAWPERIRIDRINDKTVSFSMGKGVEFRIKTLYLTAKLGFEIGKKERKPVTSNKIKDFNAAHASKKELPVLSAGQKFNTCFISGKFIEQYVPASESYSKVPTDVLKMRNLEIERINKASICIVNDTGTKYRIKLKDLTGCQIESKSSAEPTDNPVQTEESRPREVKTEKNKELPVANEFVPKIGECFTLKDNFDRKKSVLLYNQGKYVKSISVNEYEEKFDIDTIYEAIRYTKTQLVAKSSISKDHVIYIPYSLFTKTISVKAEEKESDTRQPETDANLNYQNTVEILFKDNQHPLILKSVSVGIDPKDKNSIQITQRSGEKETFSIPKSLIVSVIIKSEFKL